MKQLEGDFISRGLNLNISTPSFHTSHLQVDLAPPVAQFVPCPLRGSQSVSDVAAALNARTPYLPRPHSTRMSVDEKDRLFMTYPFRDPLEAPPTRT